MGCGRDGRKKSAIQIDSSIWREEIGNRQFGGKKFQKIRNPFWMRTQKIRKPLDDKNGGRRPPPQPSSTLNPTNKTKQTLLCLPLPHPPTRPNGNDNNKQAAAASVVHLNATPWRVYLQCIDVTSGVRVEPTPINSAAPAHCLCCQTKHTKRVRRQLPIPQ